MGRYALLIGNSQYTDDKLQQLTAPEVDVSQLADLLEDPEIGRFDDVRLLQDASESAVRRTLARFYTKRKRDDLLLVYFSGHGVRDEDGHLYLAVRDTENDVLDATAIAARYLTRQMDRSRSRRQVLILDCCHSGAFARGVKRGTRVGSGDIFEGTGYGRIVLTATDETQFAWEGNQIIGEAQGSLFTHFLLEGLRTGKADANGDGRITVDELYDYAYERVLDHTPKQTPYKWDYRRRGDIVLARAAEPPPVEPPPTLDTAKEPDSSPDKPLTLAERRARLENMAQSSALFSHVTFRKPAGWFAPDISHERISDTLIMTEKDGAKMVFVAEGEFIYGEGDGQKRIHLPGFWIGHTPVTNAQYKRFIDATNHKVPSYWDEQRRTYPQNKAEHPVVEVSHGDATAYAEWAGKHLPTEQEWEKAARGADGHTYPWGNEWRENYCNSREAQIGGTSPVGQYSPQGDSPFGCIDMSGNVWEWTGTMGGRGYIMRGGSWLSSSSNARAAVRGNYGPSVRVLNLGFRVCVRRPPSHDR